MYVLYKHLILLLQLDIAVLGSLCGPLCEVGLPVKVEEQQEEHSPVEQDDVAEHLWEVALNKQRQRRVQEKCSKLYKLHRGQVPNTKLDLRSGN